MTNHQRRSTTTFPQPLDRLAITLVVFFSLLIGILLFQGDHASARIRDFSWQGKDVGVQDTAFMLTFSRPMNQASVEKNLKLEPPLPGKVSWAGRRMAYTLQGPIPYGAAFTLKLQGAIDRLGENNSTQNPIQPFTGSFRSRDRAFAYIGIDGEDSGRLVIYNLTGATKTVLTPKNLTVTDFKIFPNSDLILFSALENDQTEKGALAQQLYTVTTGIHLNTPESLQSPQTTDNPSPFQWGKKVQSKDLPAKTLHLVLDSNDYQNQQFDLSADGRVLVVKRIALDKPGTDFGIWLVKLDEAGRVTTAPQILKNQVGGNFSITADSSSLALSEGQGLSILPLTPQAEPLDFLAKFAQLINFSRDGTQALVVKFNATDFSRSLFLIDNRGQEQELATIAGEILDAVFDPQKPIVYALLSRRLQVKQAYEEKTFLAAIDLKSKEITPLIVLPNQRDIRISLAPDGLAILFDQIIPTSDQQKSRLRTSSGETIGTSQLWLLPLIPVNPANPTVIKPEQLPFNGLRPQWLP